MIRLSQKLFSRAVFLLFILGGCFLALFIDYPAVILGGVFYLSFLALSYRRPDWACWTIILILPIIRVPKITQYVEFLQYAVVLPVAIFWFLKRARRGIGQSYISENPFHFFIIAFSLLILISTVLNGQSFNLRPLIAHIIAFIFLYFLYDFLKIYRTQRFYFFWILCFSGFCEGALAILQFVMFKWNAFSFLQPYLLPASSRARLTADAVAGASMAFRSYGTFYSPNNLGIYLAMIWPLAFVLYLGVYGRMKRIILAIICFVILAGVFLSDSRGAMVNVFVGGLFIVVFAWDKIPKRLFFGIVVSLAAGMVVFFDFLRTFLRIEGGLSYRDVIWEHAFALFGQHPWIGWGIGSMSQLSLARFGFPSSEDMDMALSEILVNKNFDFLSGFHAHNLFLNYAVELGILAVVLILYFYLFCVKSAMQYIFFAKEKPKFSRILVVGCTASILGNFVHSLFEATTSFNYLPNGLTFIFIVMILFSYLNSAENIKNA